MKKLAFLIACIMTLIAATSCASDDRTAETSRTVSPTCTEPPLTQTSETTVSETEKETLPWYEDPEFPYVPEDEWTGLETTAYDWAHPAFRNHVWNMAEGTPDPEPNPNPGATIWQEGVGELYDLSQIQINMQQEQYSLSRDEKVIVEITCPEDSVYDQVYYHYQMNLERWNGSEWDRLIYIPACLYHTMGYAMPYVERGQTVTEDIGFRPVVTKLIPGTYRAVVYINFRPVYAEFELVE